MKVLLKWFHLKGINIGFHPQTQKLKNYVTCLYNALWKEGINVTLGAFLCYIFIYPFHTHDVTAAILVSQTNPEVNAFFCRIAAYHVSDNAL